MNKPKEKPVHNVKVGLIEAAIWKNETERGPRYNVTFRRNYVVETNGQRTWRSTDSFGRDDLLTVAKLADLAHTWIAEQKTSAEGEVPPTDGASI